jgi:hypothetical protein
VENFTVQLIENCILKIELPKVFSRAVLEELDEAVLPYLDAAQSPLVLMIDVSKTERVLPDILYVRAINLVNHPMSAETGVVIGANMIVRTMSTVFAKVMKSQQVDFFETEETAFPAAMEYARVLRETTQS